MRTAARAGSNGRLGRLRWRGGTRGGKRLASRPADCIWPIPSGAPALWRWRSTMPNHCCPRLKGHLRPSPAPSTTIADGDGPPNTAAASERPADRVLRVSEAKIEALVNLAGELVVARNALSYSVKQVEQDLGGSEVARSIQRDRDAIDRLVTELHGSVLQLRMVPVAQLFGSFPRLVRDVARQLDKKVALVTQRRDHGSRQDHYGPSFRTHGASGAQCPGSRCRRPRATTSGRKIRSCDDLDRGIPERRPSAGGSYG